MEALDGIEGNRRVSLLGVSRIGAENSEIFQGFLRHTRNDSAELIATRGISRHQ